MEDCVVCGEMTDDNCLECGDPVCDGCDIDGRCQQCDLAFRQDDEDTRRGINDALDADMMEGFRWH